MTAQYKLLQPHYLQNIYVDQGTTITEGVDVPLGWVPTLNVDPLNTAAVTAFYNAGPRGLGWEQFNNFSQENYIFPIPNKPVTYWVQSSPRFYALTGLGVLLAPVFGG